MGGHFNPAVSVGLVVGGRFRAAELPGYVVAQVLGAIAAAFVLFLNATGKLGAEIGGFATNGFGEHSPGGFGLKAALLTEFVLTAVFLIVILGASAKNSAAGFGGLAIGLCLTLIHLVSIPVTNTSVNPARSTGPALFGPAIPMDQLWLFWVAPIAGAVIGAVIYKVLLATPVAEARAGSLDLRLQARSVVPAAGDSRRLRDRCATSIGFWSPWRCRRPVRMSLHPPCCTCFAGCRNR